MSKENDSGERLLKIEERINRLALEKELYELAEVLTRPESKRLRKPPKTSSFSKRALDKKAQSARNKRIQPDMLRVELSDEAKSLLAQLMDSEEFKYAKAVANQTIKTDAESLKKLGKCLQTYLFETFSYLYLRKQFKRANQILLTPNETFEFYHLLHPSRRVMPEWHGLQKGIDGISVPDGIVLKPLENRDAVRIDGLCEYSLATDRSIKHKKIYITL